MDTQMARRYAILKQQKELHAAHEKRISKEMEKLATELYKELVDAGLDSMRLSGVSNGKPFFSDGRDRIINPLVKSKPYVKAESLSEFHTWMRKEGFGDMIKESIHHQTLEKWVNEREETNEPLPPDTLMSIFRIETVNIKRAPMSANNQ